MKGSLTPFFHLRGSVDSFLFLRDESAYEPVRLAPAAGWEKATHGTVNE